MKKNAIVLSYTSKLAIIRRVKFSLIFQWEKNGKTDIQNIFASEYYKNEYLVQISIGQFPISPQRKGKSGVDVKWDFHIPPQFSN